MLNENENEIEGEPTEETADSYTQFVYYICSPLTRKKYEGRLTIFFDFVSLLPNRSFQERCNAFVARAKVDSNWVRNNIMKFLQLQKQRAEQKEISGATVGNYVKAIKLLCETSDIAISWKKITRGLPKGKRYANDRAPTLEEIRKIMEYPDRRIKPIIYTMISSGIRLGAWDYLRWRHVIPIEKNGKIVAAKLIVYGDDDEEYFTFITPEAYEALEGWIKYRQVPGENINKDSWIMRNLWDVTTPKGKGVVSVPQKLKSSGIKRLMERALWAQGVRTKLSIGKKRHEFQADHGLRKYFKTTCEYGEMSSINVEILMGHSIGISDSYLRPTENQLLEDYLKAVNSLTISQENKLILDNELMKQHNSALEKDRYELDLLRKELESLLALKNTLIKEGILNVS